MCFHHYTLVIPTLRAIYFISLIKLLFTNARDLKPFTYKIIYAGIYSTQIIKPPHGIQCEIWWNFLIQEFSECYISFGYSAFLTFYTSKHSRGSVKIMNVWLMNVLTLQRHIVSSKFLKEWCPSGKQGKENVYFFSASITVPMKGELSLPLFEVRLLPLAIKDNTRRVKHPYLVHDSNPGTIVRELQTRITTPYGRQRYIVEKLFKRKI